MCAWTDMNTTISLTASFLESIQYHFLGGQGAPWFGRASNIWRIPIFLPRRLFYISCRQRLYDSNLTLGGFVLIAVPPFSFHI
jgi:hypothetical protein